MKEIICLLDYYLEQNPESFALITLEKFPGNSLYFDIIEPNEELRKFYRIHRRG